MWFFKEDKPEELVKKYFSFLVEQYGFIYTSYCYRSEKVQITLSLGRKTPSIEILLLGEPEFTELGLRRIIQYFEGGILKLDFTTRSREHNIKFAANTLKVYMPKIIDHIDEWWIPVQLFQYKLMEEDYRKNNQLGDFLYSFKREYDYLKSKGAI